MLFELAGDRESCRRDRRLVPLEDPPLGDEFRAIGKRKTAISATARFDGQWGRRRRRAVSVPRPTRARLRVPSAQPPRRGADAANPVPGHATGFAASAKNSAQSNSLWMEDTSSRLPSSGTGMHVASPPCMRQDCPNGSWSTSGSSTQDKARWEESRQAQQTSSSFINAVARLV
jgi:hypothetical protein